MGVCVCVCVCVGVFSGGDDPVFELLVRNDGRDFLANLQERWIIDVVW